MRLALVYDPADNKLRPDTYSYTYRGMLEAILKRWGKALHITKDCSAKQIKADVILFWDVNSKHHIVIEGIDNHPAVKIEYLNDPHQRESYGIHRQYNMKVHKLGAEQRIERALRRGVKYIICPTKEGYYQFFAPVLGEDRAEKMLLFFPPAPCFKPGYSELKVRKNEVLGNGATWDGGNGSYITRKWAFEQPYITTVDHWILDQKTPKGTQFGDFIKQWAGALALNDFYPVIKYFEMPLAGCVTFAQYYKEYEELGFEDFKSCIYVNKNNFEERVKDFLAHIETYQGVADEGRKLMEENYTAQHLADFLYRFLDE